MAQSDFFLGENSAISEIWSILQTSEPIRSLISYSMHYFETADDDNIASDTAASLSVDLFFCDIIRMTKNEDPKCTLSNVFMVIVLISVTIH